MTERDKKTLSRHLIKQLKRYALSGGLVVVGSEIPLEIGAIEGIVLGSSEFLGKVVRESNKVERREQAELAGVPIDGDFPHNYVIEVLWEAVGE